MPWAILLFLVIILVRALLMSGVRRSGTTPTAANTPWRNRQRSAMIDLHPPRRPSAKPSAFHKGPTIRGESGDYPEGTSPWDADPRTADADAVSTMERGESPSAFDASAIDLRQMVVAKVVLERRPPGPYKRS